jgi:hypothetical protein
VTLSENVTIARRFQKSIRIDADMNNLSALEGFICPKSSEDVLTSMATHLASSGHASFTWTGPYGSGKSSLVLVLNSLLSADKKLHAEGVRIVGKQVADQFNKAMPVSSSGWAVVGAVGRRASLPQIIGESLEAGGLAKSPKKPWNDDMLLSALSSIIASEKNDGLLLVADEMGKVLEATAQDDGDLYIFQQIAELASRSNGKFVFIGILHQAFDEYANRLGRDVRDEWSKVQGRFVDLIVNAAGEEQIDLLSRAIETSKTPKRYSDLAERVAKNMEGQKGAISKHLASSLSHCWPLHPIVAALLGPISKRRFGQNQRSLFGFLNSAEPMGFQDFLSRATDKDLYTPALLWHYLQLNLEPSILASPDGHRWATAAEAIARCETLGGDLELLELLKTISVIDLFKDRSGIIANEEILSLACGDKSPAKAEKLVKQLSDWSLVIFKKFLGGYALYAGSDFDLEQAMLQSASDIEKVDFERINELAGLQPVMAKRHYHKTGSLRWMDIEIAPVEDAVEKAEKFRPSADSIGLYLLCIPTKNESAEEAEKIARKASKVSKNHDIVAGFSPRSWAISALANDLLTLENVKDTRSELDGDAVARREVEARTSILKSQLEAELQRTFDSATWYLRDQKEKQLAQSALSTLASSLADKRFPDCPHVANELLNRMKPSSSAIAAQNGLLKRMVQHDGEERLGIEGYPAEGGLFTSILEQSNLYQKNGDEWGFASPKSGKADVSNLAPLWDATDKMLAEHENRSVSLSEIYKLWRAEPFGVKDGIMPVLAVAYIQSKQDKVALYNRQIFQARFTDLDIDYLTKDPLDIQLRWMNLNDLGRKLLSGLAEIVRELDNSNSLKNMEPIDVGRGLISIFVSLPGWTHRTMRLSANAIQIRGLFKKANDPNQFIFNDLPLLAGEEGELKSEEGFKKIIGRVRDGLEELVGAYPSMLERLADNMLAELQVPNSSAQALAELRARADNIRELSGDFRLNAYVGRLAMYEGRREDIEGLASLATNKPARDWIDSDLDKAAIELTDFAQQFNRAEVFARVKGREDMRHSMAVVVGMGNRPAPYMNEFDVNDSDRKKAKLIAKKLIQKIEDEKPENENIVFAALAELSYEYMRRKREEDAKIAQKHSEEVAL